MNKKMKYRISMTSMAVVLMLAGCSSDSEDNGRPDNSPVPLQVNSGIQTRSTNTEWAKDDCIGIYMLSAENHSVLHDADNRCYVAQAGGENVAFGPAAPEHIIYYPIDGSAVDFIAYYPQQSLTDNVYPLNVEDQSNLPSIDLMTATAAGHSKEAPAVSFRFRHRLAMLRLTISAGIGLTAADLEGLQVEVTRQRTSGTYHILSDAFSISSEAETAIKLNTTADGTTAQAILLPNDVDGNDPLAERQLVFKLKDAGKIFYWSIPDAKYFKSGDKNLYEIVINHTNLDVTSSIEDWGNGGGGSGSAE